jgi:hypothetical protein
VVRMAALVAHGTGRCPSQRNRGGPWLAAREDVGAWAGLGIGKWVEPCLI